MLLFSCILISNNIFLKGWFNLDKHSFSYEQYCAVVGKNIIISETSYYNGRKKLKCLNLHKCKSELGGCKNNFILQKQEKTENIVEKQPLK